MKKLFDFLSGVTVYTALDRFFERRIEPRLRLKAQKHGFAHEFEQELAILKDGGADHASHRAFARASAIARMRFQQDQRYTEIIALDSTALMLDAAPKALFEAIAKAHGFTLMALTQGELHRLARFLEVAEQSKYPACQEWPSKVFLSAQLSCRLEVNRLIEAGNKNHSQQ